MVDIISHVFFYAHALTIILFLYTLIYVYTGVTNYISAVILEYSWYKHHWRRSATARPHILTAAAPHNGQIWHTQILLKIDVSNEHIKLKWLQKTALKSDKFSILNTKLSNCLHSSRKFGKPVWPLGNGMNTKPSGSISSVPDVRFTWNFHQTTSRNILDSFNPRKFRLYQVRSLKSHDIEKVAFQNTLLL